MESSQPQDEYFHTFYFQAFSDQFALLSEEVAEIIEEGETISHDENDTLSGKLHDVQERFSRIQELVEKQSDSERFEKALQDYKRKFETVNARLSHNETGKHDENTQCLFEVTSFVITVIFNQY